MAERLTTLFTPGRHGETEGCAGVTVRERSIGLLASVIARRGAAATLAAALKRDLGGGTLTLLGVGPGHWWIESAATARSVDGLQAILEGTASVFELTDSRVVLEVGGPRIRDALAKLLPIDLHPAAFKTGDVAVTSASHIGVTVWQIDDEPHYRLAVARSYFESFWRAFATASAEYGCEVSSEVSP